MILTVVLYQRHVFDTLNGANAFRERHVLIITEYFNRHFRAFATHGFGLYEEFGASERARDLISHYIAHIVDHRNVHAPLVLTRVEQRQHADHHQSGNNHQHIHAGARRNTRRDRPEQIQQIHRILDRGTVAHNR